MELLQSIVLLYSNLLRFLLISSKLHGLTPMQTKEFNKLLSRFDELTPNQRIRASERLALHVEPSAMPRQVKQREKHLLRTRKCIHCAAGGAVKNG